MLPVIENIPMLVVVLVLTILFPRIWRPRGAKYVETF